MKACYPGSFDPITNGHLDIIQRASEMYEEVDVLIMHNPRKKCCFTEEERLDMIRRSIASLPSHDNIRVMMGDDGLTVNYAQKINCGVMIRGIRAVSDYEYELQQATANMKLNPQIETVLLIARPEYSFLSSSVVREIADFGGNIHGMVPDVIEEEVSWKLKHRAE